MRLSDRSDERRERRVAEKEVKLWRVRSLD